MAKDQGTTPLYGFATVKINLVDVNDNAPQFLEVRQTSRSLGWDGGNHLLLKLSSLIGGND